MKQTKLFAVLFSMFFLIIGVKAQDVSTFEELKDCLGGENGTCVLSDNIEASSQLDVFKNITLDLNGKKISAASELELTSGILMVNYGAKLTVRDSAGTGVITTGDNTKVYAAIALTKKDVGDSKNVASLIVESGTIEGYYYGIVGNGGRHNTSIEVNGGIIKGLCEDDSTGIYNPQNGKVIISDGTIEAVTGIEIRAGELKVYDGEINSSYIPTETEKNGNGTTTRGAAIAVVQHTTKLPINVVIEGGSFNAFTPFLQKNVEGNSEEDVNKINIKIKEGSFINIEGNDSNKPEYSVFSENFTKFIEGGSFSIEPNKAYISEKRVVNEFDNYFYVSPNTLFESENASVILSSEEPLPNDYSLIITELKEEERTKVEKILEEKYKDDKLLKNADLLAIYDISMKNSNGIVKLSDGKFTIGIELKRELINYDHYKVLYFDENGEIKEEFEAELLSELIKKIAEEYQGTGVDGEILGLSEDSDSVVFETSHLSTYAVIGYNDAKTDNIPNSPTLDNISLYIIIGLMSFIVLAFVFIKIRKQYNRV